MTLLFNAESNISESKKKLIREILKSDNAEMLQEMYWLIKEEEKDAAEEIDLEDDRSVQLLKIA